MTMAMLEKENLSEKLAKIIGGQIIHNELKSGEIIVETQISKEWGVSRSPVRDALHMLEQQRLLERAPNGRYMVSELSVDYMLHFYDTVNILYRYAFSQAAENANEEELDSITSGMEKIERSLEEKDIEMYLQGVAEYAQTVLKAARNPIVEKIALELMPSAERIQYLSISYLPENLKEVAKCLKDAYQSFMERDPQNAAIAFTDFASIHKKVALKSLKPEEVKFSV
jgi:DNA-binding GntR family transcriptional regulator